MPDPIERISDILGASKGWLDRRAEAESHLEAAWGTYRDGPEYAPTDRYPVKPVFEAGWDAAKAEPDPSPRTLLQAVLNDVNPGAMGEHAYTQFLASVRHVGEQFGVEGI
jgi:hypothetical protein